MEGIRKKLVLGVMIILTASCIYAYEPKGGLEELYKLEIMPLLRTGVKCKMFSSYDRTGGNNDGFSGTYSKLREENGNSVIAEMEGAGCIQRIWFTHSHIGVEGLLNRQEEHIMIYMDGSSKPVIDVPLEDIFSGRLPQFPRPLVGKGLGGYYCYVPIPYKNGCKVVIQGTGVRFYHVTYNEFPDGEGVRSFSMEMSEEEKAQLEKAVNFWNNPGDMGIFEEAEFRSMETRLDLEKEGISVIDLPKGPQLIREVFFEVTEKGRKAAIKSRIKFFWEGLSTPAADIPLGYFFGQELNPKPFQSLLFGNGEEGFYNFIPMPYLKSGRIEISSKDPFQGSLKIVCKELKPRQDLAYFHVNYQEELPPEEGLDYVPLNVKGKGHYIGIYLTTQGEKGAPGWLEGDEKIVTDEELVIHGTGTEDYFNCGWYGANGRLVKSEGFPSHGFPVYGIWGESMRAVAYRWHITDPVPYGREITFKLEHGPLNDWSADYRSIAFFYDKNPSRVENREMVPMGIECIEYLRQRAWQLASRNPAHGKEMIGRLLSQAKKEENKILLKGLEHYFEGIQNPDSNAQVILYEMKMEMDRRVQRAKQEDLYEQAKINLPTDSDRPIPKSLAKAQSILDRAWFDLSRRVTRHKGLKPGDEVVVEARNPYGELTPEPYYKETRDFTNSYAKAEDVHLVGKGARFTYGNATPSWARFTPDFPESGRYEVFTIFSYGANAGDTRYLIKHADGATTVALEQRGRPGTPERNNLKWLSLGIYRFEKGLDTEKGSVALDASPGLAKPNEDIEYRAYADAVRFEFKGRGEKK